MDTPSMHSVEGDNHRLTSGLQPMGCVQNPVFFSFRFRKCFFFYTGNYLVVFYESYHSSLNTEDESWCNKTPNAFI